mgnify:CR=1 FL=1
MSHDLLALSYEALKISGIRSARASFASLCGQALGPQDRILCTVGLRIYPGTELARIACEEGALSAESDLVEPTFYFSPHISPARVLELLESSPLRPQMLYLGQLQRREISWALRARSLLRLSGAPWGAVPLYNRLTRWVGVGRPR